MNKKHYQLIAQALREAREGSREDKQVIRHIVTELIRVFTIDNERFDSKRFEDAIYKGKIM